MHTVHIHYPSIFSSAENMEMCPCVCVGVQLSHTALGNLMRPLCSEEGNRDSWLELHTLALPQAHRRTDSSLTSSGNGDIGCSSMDYTVHSHTSSYILAHKNLRKLSTINTFFFFEKAGCVLDLIINYSEGPALANQTKPWSLFSYEQLWWVLCVCLEGKRYSLCSKCGILLE